MIISLIVRAVQAIRENFAANCNNGSFLKSRTAITVSLVVVSRSYSADTYIVPCHGIYYTDFQTSYSRDMIATVCKFV